MALLSAVSCTVPRYISSEPVLQSEWIGNSHADIVQEFGAPSREVSDGADGTILVYENVTSTYDTSEFMGDYSTTVTNTRLFKEFYLDANGICKNVRSNEQIADGKKFSPGWTLLTAGSAFLTFTLITKIISSSGK